MQKKSPHKVNGLTRRDFMKCTGGATAMMGISAAGLGVLPGRAEAQTLPSKWDLEEDVIVIGSGFAGLAAALETANAGASVAIFEKMAVAGGNSIINGGVIAAAGSPMQAAKGIQDAPESMLADMTAAGLDLNYPELARMVAERSAETFQWTVDYLGVKYMALLHMGGHRVARSHMTHNSSGSAIVSRQLEKLKAAGIRVQTRTYLENLIQDADGRVVGVKIRQGYRFPDAASGKSVFVKARRGVILATGGFSNDVDFRRTQDPKLQAHVDSTNQPGATAEAFKEALRAGGTPVQPSWIQLGPWASPDEKGFGLAPHFASGAVFTYGIMVDPRTGRRFVSELADRKIRADAIIKTGHAAIGIADDLAAQNCGGPPGFLDKLRKRGVVKTYDTLEGLCRAYEMPLEAVRQSIGQYNAAIPSGVEPAFGRVMQKDARPIARAPFYAVRLWPKVHHTMGGLRINTRAEAVGLDGHPIKGLFAAGEVTGGIHGAVRLGSCAVVDCLVFGRIAGKNAAAATPWET